MPTDLPAGDPSRGATLFSESINGAPSCAGCHSLNDSVVVGPGLQNYAANAKVHANGSSVEAYTYTSIVQPGNYIVSGFGNVMYAQYGRQLTPQQIADLIAYLLTL
ncbi:MAG: cytochrome c [Anaerolineae bacterium]|nr:cytochrome c [Anaerolineae bacterium]